MKFNLSSHPTWRSLVDIAELLSASVFIITGVLWLIKRLVHVNNPWILWPLVGCFGVACLLAVIRTRRELNTLKRNVKEQQVVQGINSINNKKAFSRKKPEEILPSKKFVKRTLKFIEEESKRWSSDAKLGSDNLYIDISATRVDHTFQAYYHSEIKNLTRTFYIGSKHGKSDNLADSEGYRTLRVRADLYTAFPRWREAVIMCFNAVLETLPADYEISIQHTGEPLSITFRYRQNKISKQRSFAFDGVNIQDNQTKKNFKLDD